MAITATAITSGADATNAAAYTSGTYTPTNGLGYVACFGSSGTARTVSSITDTTGLNWVAITTPSTLNFNTSYQITCFRASKASGLVAGTTKFNLSGTASRGSWIIVELTNADTSGTDGANLIAHTPITGSGASNTSLTLTLATAITAGNATMGFFMDNTASSTAITADVGNGYTELAQVQPTAEAQDHECEFLGAGITTVQVTCLLSAIGGIGMEIAASGGAAARPLFSLNPIDGLGVGGSFFSNPLSREAVEAT